MGTEYRVIWRRIDSGRPKRKRYASKKSAEKMLALLTTKEPWTLLAGFERKGPDDYFCCNDPTCGCDGVSVREYFDGKYKDMPPIEYARIEQREVGSWSLPPSPERDKP